MRDFREIMDTDQFIGKHVEAIKGFYFIGITPVVNACNNIAGFIYDSDDSETFNGVDISDLGLETINDIDCYII